MLEQSYISFDIVYDVTYRYRLKYHLLGNYAFLSIFVHYMDQKFILNFHSLGSPTYYLLRDDAAYRYPSNYQILVVCHIIPTLDMGLNDTRTMNL